MTPTVRLSRRAQFALDSIVIWWSENRSLEQAARWHRGILAAIREAANNPDQFEFARENDQVEFDLRELHFGLGRRPSHRVLFTVQDDLVLVVAVRHVAQADLTSDELTGP